MDDRKRELLTGYVDNELTDEQRLVFESELVDDTELQAELEEFRKLKEVTGMARYADLPDEVWEGYWQSIYRKLERGFGWVIFSIGAIIMLCLGAYSFVAEFLLDPLIPLFPKLGLSAVLIGLIILLVSYGRERIFAYRRDRYSEVKK
ncbi:MAG: hypothetical protein KAT79_06420 [candidate division Zixibacteria bacterium]|nr:hypothetical protein [candidate division Zixibacteria bacterium]